jgi:hypothetical protein
MNAPHLCLDVGTMVYNFTLWALSGQSLAYSVELSHAQLQGVANSGQ